MISWIGLTLAFLSSASGGLDEETLSKEGGFAVTLPDALSNWVVRQSNGDGGAIVVTLGPDALGLIQVKIESRPATSSDEVALREALLEYAKGQPNLEDIEKIEREIGGEMRPGLRAETEIEAGRFRIEQLVCLAQGRQHLVSYHAPVTRFEELSPDFDRILASIRFQAPVMTSGQSDAKRLEELAARSGSEIEWFEDWKPAAEAARKQGRWILILVHSLPGFDIPSAVRSGLFTDPDLVDLIRERFVMLQLRREQPSPLKPQEAYGMGPSTFGTSLLCATPEGEVVYEVASVDASIAYQELRTALLEAPDAEDGPEAGADLETIGRAIRRGDLEGALEALEDRDEPAAAYLRGEALRRLRQGEDALRAYALAVDGGFDRDRVRIAKGWTLAGLGRAKEALAEVSPLTEDSEAQGAAAALALAGFCLRRLGQVAEGEAMWRRLVDDFPQSRWAWPVAAAMSSPGYRAGYSARLRWPEEDLVAGILHQPAEPVPALEQAYRSALAYLLSKQRDNGAWVSPTEAARAYEATPDPIADGITAICARSLIPAKKKKEARDAIRLAIERLQFCRDRDRLAPKLPQFMDYSVWSWPAIGWLLADALDAKLIEREVAEPWIEELLAGLAELQKGGGGWSYYLTQDLDSDAPPFNVSMSFTTAWVLLALKRIEEVGIELPDEMASRGVACLERMRGQNGAFEYLVAHDAEGLPRRTGLVGASGRGPGCELALLRWGKSSTDRLETALEVFSEHRHLLRKEQGKRLMHAGPDGLGSHYPMFDYYLAALAAGEVEPERSGRLRREISHTIVSSRGADGSYVDNPMIGRAYATAMALMVFRMTDG
ncbi:MAG: hypothetical protein RL885_25430 [Planctomycetota bacterium]